MKITPILATLVLLLVSADATAQDRSEEGAATQAPPGSTSRLFDAGLDRNPAAAVGISDRLVRLLILPRSGRLPVDEVRADLMLPITPATTLSGSIGGLGLPGYRRVDLAAGVGHSIGQLMLGLDCSILFRAIDHYETESSVLLDVGAVIPIDDRFSIGLTARNLTGSAGSEASFGQSIVAATRYRVDDRSDLSIELTGSNRFATDISLEYHRTIIDDLDCSIRIGSAPARLASDLSIPIGRYRIGLGAEFRRGIGFRQRVGGMVQW